MELFKPVLSSDCPIDCNCLTCIANIKVGINLSDNLKLTEKSRGKNLKYLSTVNWMGNREEISEAVNILYKENLMMKRKLINFNNSPFHGNLDLIHSFLENTFLELPIESKKKIYEMNISKNPEYGEYFCKECYKYNVNKKKCIHADCCGLCDDCWQCHISDEKMITCPACNKSQLLECPICYESKLTDEMIKSDYCIHHVCLSCFANAFRKGAPILDCPLCKSQFNDHICS